LLLLRTCERELEIAREVLVVAQLEAMRARLHRDATAQRAERADEATVDIQLRVGHVRLQLHDRVVAIDAAARLLRPATRDEQHESERLHGDTPSVTSITSPVSFTLTLLSAVGGRFTICEMRSTDSPVATPITQPPGESRRRTALFTPFAPCKYFSS